MKTQAAITLCRKYADREETRRRRTVAGVQPATDYFFRIAGRWLCFTSWEGNPNVEYVKATRAGRRPEPILTGKTVVNLFFENSTRTLSSFEIAARRLGADVISMPVGNSSVKKGETLIDTAMTLNAMHADVMVVRHPESGAVKLLADKVTGSVINAGDGTHEHPTQALLDALTIRRRKGRLESLV